MRYERLTDDTSILVGEDGESQLFSSSLDTNINVRRKRKRLLILLFIQLSLWVIWLIRIGYLLTSNNDNFRQGMRFLPPTLLSIIYFGYGLIVVYRYHYSGIYVLAWLSVLVCISLGANILVDIILTISHPSYNTTEKILKGVDIIMLSVLAVLLLITVKPTFELLRLIKIFKREVVDQM